MKIAICDDCQADMERLKLLMSSSNACPEDIEFYEFNSGIRLLEEYIPFDAVFLDIQMEEMDGRVVGEKVREKDPDVMIFFYTGYDVSASQVFRARPQGYLMKGMKSKELLWNLDSICEELSQREKHRLPVTCDGKAFVLNISDILYISLLNKGSKIWITDYAAERLGVSYNKLEGAGIKSSTKIDEYYSQLKSHGFIYGSKSYIINANHVEVRFKNSVRLSNHQELTISRSRKDEFDAEFGHYWGVHYRRERLKRDES